MVISTQTPEQLGLRGRRHRTDPETCLADRFVSTAISSVASLKKVDPVVRDAVYKPILLSESPRAATFKHVAKRLRLSYTLKRIAHNCLAQVKNPECRVAIGLDPMS